MVAIRVAIDGQHWATVSTDGLDVLGFSIHGTRVDERLAHMRLSGGRYPSAGPSGHLIWLDEASLKQGQNIAIGLIAHAPTGCRGRSIEEMFARDEALEGKGRQPESELFAELAQQPHIRAGFSFRFQYSKGAVFEGATNADEHGFGFDVLWNSFHLERARVSLHSYSLESLRRRESGRYHVQETLLVGDAVSFRLL